MARKKKGPGAGDEEGSAGHGEAGQENGAGEGASGPVAPVGESRPERTRQEGADGRRRAVIRRTLRVSEDLQISFSVALSEADRLRHEYITLEHLLYALALDEKTAKVLRHAGANIERLKKKLARFLEVEVPSLDIMPAAEPRVS